MDDRSARKRLRLAGTAIAPGLVVGPAYILRQISLDALESRPFPVEDTAQEIERLSRALDQTVAQLRQLRAKVDTRDRRDVADIFDAQVSLLEDAAFLERIKEAVLERAVNTEHLIAIEVRRLAQSAANARAPVTLSWARSGTAAGCNSHTVSGITSSAEASTTAALR